VGQEENNRGKALEKRELGKNLGRGSGVRLRWRIKEGAVVLQDIEIGRKIKRRP
jgi:hypothetical protein